VSEFKRQDLANTAWAFACANRPIGCNAVRGDGEDETRGTTHHGLANTAGAFARMRQLDEKLLAEMARRGDGCEISSEDLAITAWAFAYTKGPVGCKAVRGDGED